MFLQNIIMERGSELLQPFSSLSGFAMAIEDRKGLVLGGTGQWTDKVGTHRPEGSYFDLTLKTGEPYTCTNPKSSPQCFKCPIQKSCPYSFTASYPIIINGELIGLIGYLGYENKQREHFIEKQPVFMEALKRLTIFLSVLSTEVVFQDTLRNDSFFHEIFNEFREGILFLDGGLRVTYANHAASSILESSLNELLGERLKKRMPEVDTALKRMNGYKDADAGMESRRVHALLNSKHHGMISLHRWDNPDTCFIIFRGGSTAAQHSLTSVNNHDSEQDMDKSEQDMDKSEQGMDKFEGIIGISDVLKSTKSKVARLALLDASVVITGETGVGKELFARAIHRISQRSSGPFVVVNCAAFPESLVESELFGYEKGAFSGANREGKPGKFEVAEGGTIFLDEVGELPLNIQSKLLRAVDQKEVEKVGAVRSKKIDVRIIAATNRDLYALLKKGDFREDLYYRLNIMPLEIPPLRERREDIPLLFEYFVDGFCRDNNLRFTGDPDDLIEKLIAYDWPGNIRELKNVCQYLVANYTETAGSSISQFLPPYLRTVVGDHLNGWALPSEAGTEKVVGELLVRQALNKYGSNTSGKRKAARSLGISLSTLYRRIKRYGIIG